MSAKVGKSFSFFLGFLFLCTPLAAQDVVARVLTLQGRWLIDKTGTPVTSGTPLQVGQRIRLDVKRVGDKGSLTIVYYLGGVETIGSFEKPPREDYTVLPRLRPTEPAAVKVWDLLVSVLNNVPKTQTAMVRGTAMDDRIGELSAVGLHLTDGPIVAKDGEVSLDFYRVLEDGNVDISTTIGASPLPKSATLPARIGPGLLLASGVRHDGTPSGHNFWLLAVAPERLAEVEAQMADLRRVLASWPENEADNRRIVIRAFLLRLAYPQ